RLLRVRPGLVSFQVVVRSIMDAADFLESPEALLAHLDVEVDQVVEGTFLLVQFGQPERVPRDAEGIEVEPLDLHEVPHVPGRQSRLTRSFAGISWAPGPFFSAAQATRTGTEAIASKGNASANVAGSKKIWSSAWRNSRIRYAPCRGLISFRYARPTMASPIGSLRRSASNSRLKFRNTPWAVSGRRYARSFPVGPTSSGNIM